MILPRLQVLTVNTHKGFNPFNRRFILPELREAVRSVGADLVFLQEVLGSHSLHAARLPSWPPAPQYEYLADSMWPQFAYGRNAVYPEGHHGNAVLSKHPILAHRNLDVSVAGNEERGLLHAVIDIGRPLHAVCVHLGLREAQRQRQLQLLCELVAGLPEREPVVVAGDFNDWRPPPPPPPPRGGGGGGGGGPPPPPPRWRPGRSANRAFGKPRWGSCPQAPPGRCRWTLRPSACPPPRDSGWRCRIRWLPSGRRQATRRGRPSGPVPVGSRWSCFRKSS
ncbi:endonuclease/exonuclease/phosphatase family protein [Pseudomonas aeruginosa]|nr:endonuclease/exonuclease/phosphatase family protein [Pseudomonas aeruginosa]MCV6143156.1 endonuclease/exonuclease/phosphatase family protein [Pseudomonas aeruginosa]